MTKNKERGIINRNCKTCGDSIIFQHRRDIEPNCRHCQVDLAMIKLHKDNIEERKNKNRYNMKLLLPSEKTKSL